MEKEDIEDLKNHIGHIAEWHLWNWKENIIKSKLGKLESVTDTGFVIAGEFYPFTAWKVVGANHV